MYSVIKTYGHEQGLSCAFRQWRATDTHCRFIHGYPLKFEFEFRGDNLDERNWLISFGELKEVKQWLTDNFDHKTCIAHDDPELQLFLDAEMMGVIQLNIVSHVGVEKFAEMAYEKANEILADKLARTGAKIYRVTVAEHGGNSASYYPDEVAKKKAFPYPTLAEMVDMIRPKQPSTVNSPVIVTGQQDKYWSATKPDNTTKSITNY